jgi:hypothetical protein
VGYKFRSRTRLFLTFLQANNMDLYTTELTNSTRQPVHQGVRRGYEPSNPSRIRSCWRHPCLESQFLSIKRID